MSGILPRDLRVHVIEPVLKRLDPHFRGAYSLAAVRLLVGTAAVESGCGRRLKQIRGRALGIFQVEPATHADVYDWIFRRPGDGYRVIVGLLAPAVAPIDQLTWNNGYATAVARLVYWRRPEPLPAADDLPGLAAYWKRWYNTRKGRGTVKKFITAYESLEYPL